VARDNTLTLHPARLYAFAVRIFPSALLVLLLVAGAKAQDVVPSNPLANDPHAIELGRLRFEQSCAPCHGKDAGGGRGPSLLTGKFASGGRDYDLYRTIFSGVGGTEMRGYGSFLGQVNVWRLVSYIRSLSTRSEEVVTGNAAEGEKLFWGKGACAQCHRVADKGGAVGPDLTRIGRERSLSYLRDSLLSPNADLRPGYTTVTVVTRSGKTIVGAEKNIDNFSVQLMDTSGNFHSFQRSKLTSVKREYSSLMPDIYKSLFAPHELDDLLAYLKSLKGAQ
jgi:putative heme-binding domain-containing protein